MKSSIAMHGRIALLWQSFFYLGMVGIDFWSIQVKVFLAMNVL
jgi:hypothetical protein